jgi:hypothetical protein
MNPWPIPLIDASLWGIREGVAGIFAPKKCKNQPLYRFTLGGLDKKGIA